MSFKVLQIGIFSRRY